MKASYSCAELPSGAKLRRNLRNIIGRVPCETKRLPTELVVAGWHSPEAAWRASRTTPLQTEGPEEDPGGGEGHSHPRGARPERTRESLGGGTQTGMGGRGTFVQRGWGVGDAGSSLVGG